MSTDELLGDGHAGSGGSGGSGGEIHDLLGTAFDDGVPVLNLVPGAVDGYRKHRRRARTLGTVGGALALVAVAVAGTVLGAGGRHQAQTTTTGSGPNGPNPVSPKTVARCTGTYQLLGSYDGLGVYSADQQRLAAVCEQDLTTLQQLIGDPSLGPLAQSVTPYPVMASTMPTSETTPHVGGSGALLQPGQYLGESDDGRDYHLFIEVYDKTPLLGGNCTSKSCPPNLKLADGRPATKVTGALRDHYVVIHYDATHTVEVSAGLENRNSDEALPFDFDKLIASPALARLISSDVHTLDLLTHPS